MNSLSLIIVLLGLSLNATAQIAPIAVSIEQRVYDSRINASGTVVSVSPLQVRLDSGVLKTYSDYYAMDLGAAVDCSIYCIGQRVSLNIHDIFSPKEGTIFEVFVTYSYGITGRKYTKYFYAIAFDNENKIRFISDDHHRWMK